MAQLNYISLLSFFLEIFSLRPQSDSTRPTIINIEALINIVTIMQQYDNNR